MQQESQFVTTHINVAECICLDNYLNNMLNPVFVELELKLDEEVDQIISKILNSIKLTFKVNIRNHQLYLYPSGYGIMLRNQLNSNCFIIHQLQYQSELYLLLSKKYQEIKQFKRPKEPDWIIPINNKKKDFFNSSDCLTHYCIEISGKQVCDQPSYFNYIFKGTENEQAITYHFQLVIGRTQLTKQYSIQTAIQQTVTHKIRFEKFRICDLPLASILLIHIRYKLQIQKIKIPIFNADHFLNEVSEFINAFGNCLVVSFQKFLKPIKCNFEDPKQQMLNSNLKDREIQQLDLITEMDGYHLHYDIFLEQKLSNQSLLHCILLLSPQFPQSFKDIALKQFIQFEKTQILPFIQILLRYLYKEPNEQLEYHLIEQSLNDVYFGQQVFWRIQYLIKNKKKKSNLIYIQEILLLNVDGLLQQQQTELNFIDLNIQNVNELEKYIIDKKMCISFLAQNNLQIKQIKNEIQMDPEVFQLDDEYINISNYIDMPTINSIPIKISNNLKSYLDYIIQLHQKKEFYQNFNICMSNMFVNNKYLFSETQTFFYVSFLNQIFLENGMNYYLIVNEHVYSPVNYVQLKGQSVNQIEIEGILLMDINEKSKDNKLLKSYAGYIILFHLFEISCSAKHVIITQNGILQFPRMRNIPKKLGLKRNNFLNFPTLNNVIKNNNLFTYFNDLIIQGMKILRQQKYIDLFQLLLYTLNIHDMDRLKNQLENDIDLQQLQNTFKKGIIPQRKQFIYH